MPLSEEHLREAKRKGAARFQDAMYDIRGRYTAQTDKHALLELVNSLPEEARNKALSIPEIGKVIRELEDKNAIIR